MAFVNKILGKFLGNKSDRDIREITPIVEQIRKEYQRITQLSNDELRDESSRLKQLIADRIKPENDEINDLKEKVCKI